ncbi:MAG: GNAT family N-acetyltransferase [Acidobacteriota bacterium]|nr:GNAT family N-acetyltransferase [Acidobacteriota bacterium]
MTFDLQPRLQGKLLELRPLAPQDFDALYQAASDPLIWEQHPESDRYQRDVFQSFFDSALESRGAFAVIECKTGRIIGSSRYARLDVEQRQVEVGWTFLERAFWGGEYNGELKALMLDHAFRFVDRVLFIVGENNLRSQRAVEKVGGSVVGKEERPGRDGRMEPNAVLAITREEWKNRHKRDERKT